MFRFLWKNSKLQRLFFNQLSKFQKTSFWTIQTYSNISCESVFKIKQTHPIFVNDFNSLQYSTWIRFWNGFINFSKIYHIFIKIIQTWKTDRIGLKTLFFRDKRRQRSRTYCDGCYRRTTSSYPQSARPTNRSRTSQRQPRSAAVSAPVSASNKSPCRPDPAVLRRKQSDLVPRL